VHILVIEDEHKVARALQEGLEGEHYETEVARTGEEGFFRASDRTFDLIVLDLMLPGRDGVDILKLGRPATVFNETLARLEEAFDRLKRFTSDASHELRTPLTAIRSVGEVGLRERRDEKAYRDIIGSMLEEVDRLTRLVDSLLTLTGRRGPGEAKGRTNRSHVPGA
jgi:signal transduction histidine kinase